MAAVIPKFLRVAKGGLTNVIITPQTEASDGTLTDGTAVTVTAKLAGIDHTASPTKKEISAITSPRRNNVVIDDGYTVQVKCLKVDNGTDVDVLRTMMRAYDTFKISWVEGQIAGGIQTITLYGSRGDYSFSAEDKGDVIATLNFDNVDPGATDFYKSVTT